MVRDEGRRRGSEVRDEGRRRGSEVREMRDEGEGGMNKCNSNTSSEPTGLTFARAVWC